VLLVLLSTPAQALPLPVWSQLHVFHYVIQADQVPYIYRYWVVEGLGCRIWQHVRVQQQQHGSVRACWQELSLQDCTAGLTAAATHIAAQAGTRCQLQPRTRVLLAIGGSKITCWGDRQHQPVT